MRSSFIPGSPRSEQIKIELPASLDVELQYRQPSPPSNRSIARRRLVSCRSTPRASACRKPTSATPNAAPAAHFRRHRPAARRRRWNDDRVTGAATLAAQLADVWSQLRLVEIIPSMHAQVRDDTQLLRVRNHDQRRHADRLGRGARPRTGRRPSRRSTQSASGCSTTPPARPARIDRRPGRRSMCAATWSCTPRTARQGETRRRPDEIRDDVRRRRRSRESIDDRSACSPMRAPVRCAPTLRPALRAPPPARRRFDADAHAAMADFDHGDGNLVADQNPLADFSTEN